MRTVVIACVFALAAAGLNANLAAASNRTFTAKLEPSEAFVPADAQGQATFRLSGDGGELSYEVTVKNIELVTQAHIHLDQDALKQETFPRRFEPSASPRGHGPIVAFLLKFSREGITVDGLLAEGRIRGSDLVGPLRGQPLSLLIDFIEKGDAYIALHVLQPLGQGQVYCCPDGLRGTLRAAP
jgi:hypothetical protein